MKYLILVLEIIHILVILSILIPFFINDKNILLYYYYFCLFIIGGWILFNNKCWLSILEKKIKNDEKNKKWAFMEYIEKYLNISINSKSNEKNVIQFLYISYSISFLVLSYKLDLFYQGLSIIFIYFVFAYLHKKNKK